MRITSLALAATLCFACGKHDEPALSPPPAAKPPVRGAVGDSDLRVMLAEVASAKACEMIRGAFRGLRDVKRPDVMTGLLWIQDCSIDNDGTKVTFVLSGHGWSWADETKKKAGATFQIREYVKFAVKATLHGAIDIAYDRHDHVVSLWFSPSRTPDIVFEPIGDVDVDPKGLWSSVLGGISSVFTESPDEQGEKQAKSQGTHEFASQLADGLTVAIDLCTGLTRFSLGRPPKGDLGPPDPGESHHRPIEIQPGGLFAFGPYLAPKGMSLVAHSDGPVQLGMACVDDIDGALDAFLNEQPLQLAHTIGQTEVRGTGRLEVKPQKCKVAVIARSAAPDKVTFDWKRPAAEAARSTGGPAIHCARKTTLSSDGDGSGSGRAAARRR